MSEKKLFRDKRWTEYYGCEVVGHSEISEESKKWAEECSKRVRKEVKKEDKQK